MSLSFEPYGIPRLSIHKMLRLMTGKYQAAIATGLAKLFAFIFNGVS